MVDEQIARRGICDEKVLSAFRKVPRHAFIPEEFHASAYSDHPLPIGEDQTISQPYMVALMTECLKLKGGETVLEIGTGSGYQAAILAEIAGEVFSVERLKALADRASAALARLGYRNFSVKVDDGTLGWAEYSPYDGIIVTAAAPQIPATLARQLKEGGRLVIPVGDRFSQVLTVAKRTGNDLELERVCGCVFVPLVGREGWNAI
jgi:protein-L-isoaspartate(D-aspartate) O-methyltransferase